MEAGRSRHKGSIYDSPAALPHRHKVIGIEKEHRECNHTHLPHIVLSLDAPFQPYDFYSVYIQRKYP